MKFDAITERFPASERSETANQHIRSIGMILPFYSSPIRAIYSSQSILSSQDAQTLQTFAVASALPSIKVSPTLTESFQLAANELYQEYIQELRRDGIFSLYEILNLLEPNEIAGLLGITYYFKLLKKVCNEEEFTVLAPTLSRQLKVGAEEGAKISEHFGRGGGIAAAGIRVLSFAVLMKADLKGYKKLRRQVNLDGILLHPLMELETWGCTHLDVASSLAGRLGFGHPARLAFSSFQNKNSDPLTEEAGWWLECLERAEAHWLGEKKKGEKVLGKESGPDLLESLEGLRWLWKTKLNLKKDPLIERVEEEAATDTETPRVQTDFNNETSPVLIVEDELTSQKILENQLKVFKNKVLVGSAEEALREIEQHTAEGKPFHLAFLDVSLPGLSGIELLQKIRADEKSNGAQRPCQVLMVTAAESPLIVVEAFNEGADGYITKPVHRGRLDIELEKLGIVLSES